MVSKTYMIYKGNVSNKNSEFGCITFSADKIEPFTNETGSGIVFFSKDNKEGFKLVLMNDCRMREI